MLVRLNKYLASLGIASRRKIDELISQQKIAINGKMVDRLGIKVDPLVDKITISGKPVINQNRLTYLLVNKPKGIVSTTSDEHQRDTVVDLVQSKVRLYPIGRLDKNSTGAIILTNDGNLTNQLTHPKYHIPKTYHLTIEGSISDKNLKALQNGVILEDGGITKPAQVKIFSQTSKQTVLEIILYEGRNRQIRRMCTALNLQLRFLNRVAIGPIKLGDLVEGNYRPLTQSEIELLLKSKKT